MRGGGFRGNDWVRIDIDLVPNCIFRSVETVRIESHFGVLLWTLDVTSNVIVQ